MDFTFAAQHNQKYLERYKFNYFFIYYFYLSLFSEELAMKSVEVDIKNIFKLN